MATITDATTFLKRELNDAIILIPRMILSVPSEFALSAGSADTMAQFGQLQTIPVLNVLKRTTTISNVLRQ
jgi:hypothetical protein